MTNPDEGWPDWTHEQQRDDEERQQAVESALTKLKFGMQTEDDMRLISWFCGMNYDQLGAKNEQIKSESIR